VGTRLASGKKFVVPLRVFGSTRTISRFDEPFVTCSTFWSVSSLPHGAPPEYPAICNSGGTCHRVPWFRRHWWRWKQL